MKFILILVLFNIQSGSEVITAEFDDAQACKDAALRTFQGVDSKVEMQILVPVEGATVIEGTTVANDAKGNQLGMFSCSPSRSEASNG